MITVSSSSKTLTPDKVILDTIDLLKALRENINKIRDLDSEEADHVLQLIFEALHYDKNADFELEYGCLDVIRSFLGLSEREDFAEAETAIMEFSTELLKQIRRLRLYQNGYLFYQFLQTLGNSVVLVRIDPPEI